MTALATFFDQYVFGHDRAALLAAQLPATAAGHAEQQARLQAHLRAELARIDVAERALIDELEKPADPANPAARAYRDRIRERFAERYAERTKIEAQLATLHRHRRPPGPRPRPARPAPASPPSWPARPSGSGKPSSPRSTSRPCITRKWTRSPYGRAITEDTPRTVAALLADPRTDDDTGHAPAVSPAHRSAAVSHSGPGPIIPQILPQARILPDDKGYVRTDERNTVRACTPDPATADRAASRNEPAQPSRAVRGTSSVRRMAFSRSYQTPWPAHVERRHDSGGCRRSRTSRRSPRRS